MPSKPRTLRPAAQPSAADYDQRRGSAAARGYDRRWQWAREAFLCEHPLCAYCELEGAITAASLIDHLYPHRRYAGVFWEQGWWVPSCAPCHDGFKQRVEREGKAAIDALARRLGRPVLAKGGGSKV